MKEIFEAGIQNVKKELKKETEDNGYKRPNNEKVEAPKDDVMIDAPKVQAKKPVKKTPVKKTKN